MSPFRSKRHRRAGKQNDDHNGSANAATPISTAVFLPNRFCDARAISAAAATQTAAAASAMPSSVHSQDSS